jgi:biotin carboxylase
VDEARRARPRLLVLGAGAAQLGLLAAARRRGLYLVAADRDPQAPGFPLADERAVISSEDEDAVQRLARARRVGGIVSPGADWPVAIAARVAARLGLPHPLDEATAMLATHKARQRERLAAAGVPQPAVYLPDDPALPIPCVVKPPDRQGQRGVTLVRRRSELGPAVAVAVAASRGGTSIAEELVDGPELTVNAVTLDGVFHPLTVTDRLTADPPAFGVALAHAWPSAHDTAPVVEVARVAVEALGIRHGPSYTQLRIGADGPRVVEVAARLGGGHDAELCRVATGIDLDDLAISFALGDSPRVDEPISDPERGACVLFLVAPEGVLTGVAGVAAAEEMDGVDWVRVYRRPGWRFGPLREGADRAGATLVVGRGRSDALARARRAAEAVRFLVDAHPT